MGKPFQATLDLTWLAGAANATNFDLVVPHGKRLVIHQISGRANMPSATSRRACFRVPQRSPGDMTIRRCENG